MMHCIILFVSLFCCAFAQCETQKTVAIITCRVPNMKPWDPDTIKSGIVGSEEAAIYISQELVNLGYKVLVYGNAPEDSPYSAEEANPRFLPSQPQEGDKFDIAISWRMPGLAAQLRRFAPKVYLWPHDILVNNFGLTDEQVNGFDDVLWLSKWQRNQYSAVHPGFARYKNIYGNGINPKQFKPVQERKNPYSCVYGSNYARGLEILLDIWPTVKQTYPRASLDIYYGWQHWGLMSQEKEAKMRHQVASLESLDVHEHGLVGHEELNRAYEQASFWTYPCIAPETFCITAIRAQLGGCMPVVNEGSALKETVRFGYKSTKPEDYLSVLLSAIKDAEKITVADRQNMGQFVLEEYTWEAIARKWKNTFELSEVPISALPKQNDQRYTIVTAFFDIKRDSWDAFSRPIDFYLNNAKRVLSLDDYMVIYTEPQFIDFVMGQRQWYKDKTKIIVLETTDLPYYKYKDQIQAIMEDPNFKQGLVFPSCPEVSKPLYDVLAWSKLPLVVRALDDNPFNTTHFAWLDFGTLAHMLPDSALGGTLLTEVPDRIKILCRSLPSPTDLNIEQFYKSHTNRFVATLFSGDASTLRLLNHYMEEEVQECLRKKVVESDQALLSIIFLKHPELFELYYGDWADLITNYTQKTSRAVTPKMAMQAG